MEHPGLAVFGVFHGKFFFSKHHLHPSHNITHLHHLHRSFLTVHPGGEGGWNLPPTRWQGYMPPILPEDLYRELEVGFREFGWESFVFGRGKVEEFFFREDFFFHRNDCVGFVVFLKKPTGTRSSVEELETMRVFFLTRIVPIYVLNGLDETKLFISVHLFNVFLEGISRENT